MKITITMLKQLNHLWRNLLKTCTLLIAITRVEHRKQTRQGYQQDAYETVNSLTRKNDELWDKKNKLKEENARLLGIIEELNKSSSGIESVPDIGNKKIKRKAQVVDEWASNIESQGYQLIRDVYKVLRKGNEAATY